MRNARNETLGAVLTVASGGASTRTSSWIDNDYFNAAHIGIQFSSAQGTTSTLTVTVEGAAPGTTGTAYTIDLANGSVQILTLTGNVTYTFPTATAGRSFLLIEKQDATGSRTVTWPAAVKWPSGTAPTITSTASRSICLASRRMGPTGLVASSARTIRCEGEVCLVPIWG